MSTAAVAAVESLAARTKALHLWAAAAHQWAVVKDSVGLEVLAALAVPEVLEVREVREVLHKDLEAGKGARMCCRHNHSIIIQSLGW